MTILSILVFLAGLGVLWLAGALASTHGAPGDLAAWVRRLGMVLLVGGGALFVFSLRPAMGGEIDTAAAVFVGAEDLLT